MRTLAVLALFATTVHAQERVGPLTLDQAVGFAIAHHPALQAEAPAEEVRREQVSVARADYLPSVDLSLQKRWNGQRSARWPLLHEGHPGRVGTAHRAIVQRRFAWKRHRRRRLVGRGAFRYTQYGTVYSHTR